MSNQNCSEFLSSVESECLGTTLGHNSLDSNLRDTDSTSGIFEQVVFSPGILGDVDELEVSSFLLKGGLEVSAWTTPGGTENNDWSGGLELIEFSLSGELHHLLFELHELVILIVEEVLKIKHSSVGLHGLVLGGELLELALQGSVKLGGSQLSEGLELFSFELKLVEVLLEVGFLLWGQLGEDGLHFTFNLLRY